MSCQCGNGCNNYTTPTSFSNVDISGSAIVNSTIAGSSLSGATFSDTAVFNSNATVAGAVSVAGNVDVTGDLLTDGEKVGYNVSAAGAGTAYSLTNTASAINLGTTDPALVLDKAGTYLILGQSMLVLTGATVVAETASLKVRRTNNTAADLSAVVVFDLPVVTTLTHSLGTVVVPPFVYVTTSTTDAISLFANVSATLGAGTVDAVAAGTTLVAVRLF